MSINSLFAVLAHALQLPLRLNLFSALIVLCNLSYLCRMLFCKWALWARFAPAAWVGWFQGVIRDSQGSQPNFRVRPINGWPRPSQVSWLRLKASESRGYFHVFAVICAPWVWHQSASRVTSLRWTPLDCFLCRAGIRVSLFLPDSKRSENPPRGCLGHS